MVIFALDLVPQCFGHEDGETIRSFLQEKFEKNEVVTFSFTGVTDVPSSFINAAFVPFVIEYGTEWVKANLKIIGARKQIVDMIRLCFENAELASAAA